MFRIVRPLGAAVLVLAVTVLSGCQGDRHSATPAAPPAAGRAVSRVLDALDARRVYVMAGDDALHAGFGLLDRAGLRSWHLDPDPALISNVAGNGHDVVLGAAGRAGHAQDGGFITDAAFRLDASHDLVTLAGPERGLFAPTIAPSGTIAAIQSEGGFSVFPGHQKDWVRDARLSHAVLSPLAWLADGAAYTVTRAGTPRAALVRLGAHRGVTTLGSVYCASAVLSSPAARRLVTRPAVAARVRRSTAGCDTAHVLDQSGHDLRALPVGWTPLAWSADGDSLLVSHRNEVGVWRSTGGLVARADVGTHLWMAAPIWR